MFKLLVELACLNSLCRDQKERDALRSIVGVVAKGFLIGFGIFFLLILAQMAKGAEPPGLTKAREAYQQKLREAEAPITRQYIKDLNEMMRWFGGRGDLEQAKTVQEEIKSREMANSKEEIVGLWQANEGSKFDIRHKVFIRKDTDGKNHRGSVKIINSRECILTYSEQDCVDTLLMTADGKTIICKNNLDGLWFGTRVDTP